MINEQLCDACGTNSTDDLYECPTCGQHVCQQCYCGVGAVCIDCVEAGSCDEVW
jgi:hypothetical protein